MFRRNHPVPIAPLGREKEVGLPSLNCSRQIPSRERPHNPRSRSQAAPQRPKTSRAGASLPSSTKPGRLPLRRPELTLNRCLTTGTHDPPVDAGPRHPCAPCHYAIKSGSQLTDLPWRRRPLAIRPGVSSTKTRTRTLCGKALDMGASPHQLSATSAQVSGGPPVNPSTRNPPGFPDRSIRRGAESGSRTRTSLRTSVFETDASACSATSARP